MIGAPVRDFAPDARPAASRPGSFLPSPRAIARVALVLMAGPGAWAQTTVAEFGGRPVPAERAEAAALTRERCTACHTLDRIVRAKHRGAAWTAVVAKMQRKPKAEISAEDAAMIAGFLGWWSGGEAAPADPAKEPGASLRTAVIATGRIPSGTALPARVSLDGLDVEVVAVAWETDPSGGGRARIGVALGKRREEAVLDRGADGSVRAQPIVIRSFRLAEEEFRLVLSISDVNTPSEGVAAPDITLALVLEKPAVPLSAPADPRARPAPRTAPETDDDGDKEDDHGRRRRRGRGH